MKKPIVISAVISALSLFAPVASGALALAFEFNTAGDTEGFTANGSTLTVASGFASGTTSSPDVQFRSSTTLNLTRAANETWSTVVFRVRETNPTSGVVTPFSPLGVLVATSNSTNPNAGNSVTAFTSVDDGGGFFVVTADISGQTALTINSLRVDPIGGPDSDGNSFDVDYIRINKVPEPSTAILGALGSLMLLRRRR